MANKAMSPGKMAAKAIDKKITKSKPPVLIVKEEQYGLIPAKAILEKYGIKIILDAGCGIIEKDIPALGLTNYYGIDIEPNTVKKNSKKSRHGVSFHKYDIKTDLMPQADLIICDCLMHFDEKDKIKTIKNFERNNAKYILVPAAIRSIKALKLPEPLEKIGDMALWEL